MPARNLSLADSRRAPRALLPRRLAKLAAPGFGSTTICWPSFRDRPSAITRALTSTPPPAVRPWIIERCCAPLFRECALRAERCSGGKSCEHGAARECGHDVPPGYDIGADPITRRSRRPIPRRRRDRSRSHAGASTASRAGSSRPSAHTAAPRTSGEASARAVPTAAGASVGELPAAISTLRMKRSRPVRFTAVLANIVRNAASSNVATRAAAARRPPRGRASFASRPCCANLFHGHTARQSSQP